MEPIEVENKGIYDERASPLQDEVEEEGSLLCPDLVSCALSTLFFPIWCFACTIIQEKEEGVVLTWGKYVRTMREPGIYVVNPCGVEVKKMSVALQTIDLPGLKVADLKGNPLQLSAIVTFRYVNSKRACIDVEHAFNYIRNQATSVLKNVASQYAYENTDPEVPSLKSEATQIGKSLVAELDKRAAFAGADIVSFELTDLSYAPEIAQAMLVRQQAEAKVDARKVIVEGAVDIAVTALEQLRERGIKMTASDEATLVTNLMVTVCSEGPVQPTLSVQR